jgi:hypothetical protein
VRRLTRRLARETSPVRKVVVRRSFAAEQGVQVSLGNHAALRVKDGRVEPLPHALLEGVVLAHFPVRSPEQVATKVLVGWLAHRLTQPERYMGARAFAKEGPASHWHDAFERLAHGEVGVDERLRDIAVAAYAGNSGVELVEDPLPVAYELRHSQRAAPNPLATLAAWGERLVADANAGRLAAR